MGPQSAEEKDRDRAQVSASSSVGPVWWHLGASHLSQLPSHSQGWVGRLVIVPENHVRPTFPLCPREPALHQGHCLLRCPLQEPALGEGSGGGGGFLLEVSPCPSVIDLPGQELAVSSDGVQEVRGRGGCFLDAVDPLLANESHLFCLLGLLRGFFHDRYRVGPPVCVWRAPHREWQNTTKPIAEGVPPLPHPPPQGGRGSCWSIRAQVSPAS